MKKFVSLILAVMMVLAMSATAFADGYGRKTYEHGIYDYGPGWWYDYNDPDGYYNFDQDEQNEVVYAFAEAMSKAEGLAALTHLITKLQERGMSLLSYEVVKEKTANHVYYIQAMNRNGDVWCCYYATFTHDSAEKVMANLLAGKRVKYYSIFLTNYVEGQKIKSYDEVEMITGFDVPIDEAIEQFIYKLEHYDEYYGYYYGYEEYYPWDNG